MNPPGTASKTTSMAMNPADPSSSLQCCSAGAAVPRSAWVRSAGFLGRSNRNDAIGLQLYCVPRPTAWSYAHNSDSDSGTLPPGPGGWFGEALLDEDAEFSPLVDCSRLDRGRKLEAIWRALVADPLESIVLTLREIMAAGNLFRCRSFHVGTLSGALLVVAGLCQLCKTTPTLVMDIVLGYVFYKLSALSAQLQRDGRSFSICARIQLVLLLVLSFKDNSAFKGFYRYLIELVWFLNVCMYSILVYDGAVGVKDGRLSLLGIYRLL